MADPVTGIAVVAGVAQGVRAYYQSEEAESKMAAIELESQQRLLQHQQKTLANFELTNRILDEQVGIQSTKEVAFNSPSFEAIQRSTVNTGVKRQKNLDIEQDIAGINEDIEKRNVKDTLWSQLFGDVADSASEYAGIKSKLPSKA